VSRRKRKGQNSFSGILLFLLAAALIKEYWYIIVAIFAVIVILCLYRKKGQQEAHEYEFQGRCVDFDSLDGHQFEEFCADILKKNKYFNVKVTKASGDYGADIIAYKHGKKYVIQCKCYSKNVGNKAVQEVYSGKSFYKADIAVVMTNSFFTKSAIETAKRNDVYLWDRNSLQRMINEAKSRTMVVNGMQKHNLSINKTYPAGEYLIGRDLPLGSYVFIAKSSMQRACVTLYPSLKKYKDEEDEILYQYFQDDYHLSLMEINTLLVVENAEIQKI
jgi:HJR/Mrr/RecB family endonuclease